MNGNNILVWTGRIALLLLLFYALFISGTMAVSKMLPEIKSEPGMVSGNIGFLIFGISNMLVVIGLVLSSRWNGWKLALTFAFAYYGAVTFLTQIETWYFMSNVTFDSKTFTAFIYNGFANSVCLCPPRCVDSRERKNQ